MNSSIFAEWKVETDFKNTRIDYYLKKNLNPFHIHMFAPYSEKV